MRKTLAVVGLVVVAGIAGGYAFAASGGSAENPACARIRTQATQLGRAANDEAGQALPLQQTDEVAFKAAVRHAAQVELQSDKIIVSNRGCFTSTDLEIVAQRMPHTEQLAEG